MDLDNQAYTIIGVLPRSFSFAPSGNAEFWVPINVLSLHEHSRTFYRFYGNRKAARRRHRAGSTGRDDGHRKTTPTAIPQARRRPSANVVPFSEIVIGNVRPILLTLLGGAALLLLIACVNVASLVLVRSESRRREIAVRGALGATYARLLQQFVTEGLLLAAFGSLAGALVAIGSDEASSATWSLWICHPACRFWEAVGWNAHTGAFAAVITLMTALLLAATATVRLSLQKLRDGLTDGDRGAAGLLWRRLGANLVVVELAIAVVLLAGAGLLGQSLYRLLHVPLGIAPDHLATVRVTAAGSVTKRRNKRWALPGNRAPRQKLTRRKVGRFDQRASCGVQLS